MGRDPDPVAISVLERVRALVARAFDRPVAEITPGTHFYRDLDDSLELVELVVECEEHFDVTLPDEEARGVETVGQLVTLIEAVLREQ